MKGLKKYMAGILVAGMVLGSAAVPAPVYATEAEDAQEDNGDDVEITLDDKPYLALGADLTADQQHTVLSYMGIEAADFDKYDVVYVSNAEEHQYLDSYVPKKQIGTKALSSVLVSLADSGNGLKVSTYNINYCTAGMYKNALATAGVEDANVIVAGPFPLSGTAALVGTFEAYEKLTGKELDESVVDAAMDELVLAAYTDSSDSHRFCSDMFHINTGQCFWHLSDIRAKAAGAQSHPSSSQLPRRLPRARLRLFFLPTQTPAGAADAPSLQLQPLLSADNLMHGNILPQETGPYT